MSNIFEWGDVLEVSKTGKHVKVQLLPKYDKSEGGDWIPFIFPYAGKDVQVGGMPIVGSRVIVINIDNHCEDKGTNKFAFGGLFDEGKNTAPTTASDSTNDKFHWMIKPPNGGSIEFYKSGNDHKIKLVATNDLTIEVTDQTEIICNDIKMGTINNVKKVVQEAHLDKFDALIDAISNNIITILNTVTDPITAVTQIQAACAAWNLVKTGLKENGANKTSEFQAS